MDDKFYYKCIGDVDNIDNGWTEIFSIGDYYQLNRVHSSNPEILMMYTGLDSGKVMRVDRDQFKPAVPIASFLGRPIFDMDKSMDDILDMYLSDFKSVSSEMEKAASDQRYFMVSDPSSPNFKVIYTADPKCVEDGEWRYHSITKRLICNYKGVDHVEMRYSHVDEFGVKQFVSLFNKEYKKYISDSIFDQPRKPIVSHCKGVIKLMYMIVEEHI